MCLSPCEMQYIRFQNVKRIDFSVLLFFTYASEINIAITNRKIISKSKICTKKRVLFSLNGGFQTIYVLLWRAVLHFFERTIEGGLRIESGFKSNSF